MAKRRHWKPPPGGAFGKGGTPQGGRDYSRSSERQPSRQPSPRQPVYTGPLEVGAVLKGYTLQASTSGDGLTFSLGDRRRAFVESSYVRELKAGYTGDFTVTWVNPSKPHLCNVEPVQRAAEQAVQPAKTIETVVEPKVEAPHDEEPIAIGDLGATAAERAIVYVDQKARGMAILPALAYLITNGTATSPQGQSVLKTLQAHLDSGRPIYEVNGEAPDSKMTLGDYLDLYHGKEGGLGVGVGEEAEKVKAPAAAEVVDKPKPRTAPKPSSRPAKRREPMTVGAGSRKGGAADMTLSQLVGTYKRTLYQK